MDGPILISLVMVGVAVAEWWLSGNGKSVLRHPARCVILLVVSTVVEIVDAVKRLDRAQKNEFLNKLAEINLDGA